MRTLQKTTLAVALLAVMTACSAQKQAERRVRRAVALCPELVQTKAHPIDTVLTVGPFSDCTLVPMPRKGETLYAPTEHGTVVVSLGQTDSVLRVGFVGAKQAIHYKDTIHYAQVAVSPADAPKAAKPKRSPWLYMACWLGGVVVGVIVLFIIALKAKV